MRDIILRTENLKKVYGTFVALDDFECEIPEGVTGLLGPNGAGKTTFIRSLLGIHPIEHGRILFEDWELPRDIVKAKDYIGYQPELPTQINRISAMKYVAHMGRMSGLPREAAIQRGFDTLHYVGLEEARYREMQTFSQGMLQKVKLAAALVHDPLLLILDEPTAGCDPDSREAILSLIEDLGQNYGKNLLISTHLLPDIERTSNYVVVMSEGRRIMQGDISNVLARTGEQIRYDIRTSGDHAAFAEVLRKHGYHILDVTFTSISCMITSGEKLNTQEIFRLARQNEQNIRMLTPYRLTLEDVFVEVVQ